MKTADFSKTMVTTCEITVSQPRRHESEFSLLCKLKIPSSVDQT